MKKMSEELIKSTLDLLEEKEAVFFINIDNELIGATIKFGKERNVEKDKKITQEIADTMLNAVLYYREQYPYFLRVGNVLYPEKNI